MQITGRVTKVENFGAFIEIEEGIEGLLPVSEISWQRIKRRPVLGGLINEYERAA